MSKKSRSLPLIVWASPHEAKYHLLPSCELVHVRTEREPYELRTSHFIRNPTEVCACLQPMVDHAWANFMDALKWRQHEAWVRRRRSGKPTAEPKPKPLPPKERTELDDVRDARDRENRRHPLSPPATQYKNVHVVSGGQIESSRRRH